MVLNENWKASENITFLAILFCIVWPNCCRVFLSCSFEKFKELFSFYLLQSFDSKLPLTVSGYCDSSLLLPASSLMSVQSLLCLTCVHIACYQHVRILTNHFNSILHILVLNSQVHRSGICDEVLNWRVQCIGG